jgi:hypothetical protein
MPETTENKRKLPKPVDFDQLYPGRFLKAGELLGRKVTLTMTSIDIEELEGEGGKKVKATVTFKETEKQLVCCKTNGICIKAMFGKVLATWVGKRITIFPDTWNDEPCIRIWGSPDIAQDLEVEIALPRRRPFKKTMHKMMPKGAAATSSSTTPSTQQSIAQLRAAESLEAFEGTRNSVWALYAAAKTDVPLDVEAVANERREQLQELETDDIPL